MAGIRAECAACAICVMTGVRRLVEGAKALKKTRRWASKYTLPAQRRVRIAYASSITDVLGPLGDLRRKLRFGKRGQNEVMADLV
jgi:hypothetical protein